MRALDLFCGAGGAAAGLAMAGFEVVGVDINPQPDYPFEFIQKDVARLSMKFVRSFDFIWASPPCQAFSCATYFTKKNHGTTYPNMIPVTHSLLDAAKRPYCIENVPMAPIRKDLVLNGQMFGLRILRRRIFEISGFYCLTPTKKSHTSAIVTVISTSGGVGKGSFATIPGKTRRVRTYQEVMQIFWTNKEKSLAEAVPPKYSWWIGRAALGSLLS